MSLIGAGASATVSLTSAFRLRSGMQRQSKLHKDRISTIVSPVRRRPALGHAIVLDMVPSDCSRHLQQGRNVFRQFQTDPLPHLGSACSCIVLLPVCRPWTRRRARIWCSPWLSRSVAAARLRDMIKPHNGDEARMQAAEAIVRQIEQSNFRVERVPPRPPHSTPGPTVHD